MTKRGGALVAATALVLAVRMAIPEYAQYRINRQLDSLDEYQGHIEDVDLALWRGAYRIEGVDISKVEDKQPLPLFSAEVVDLSLSWRALFRGAVLADVHFQQPHINFIDGKNDADQTGEHVDWRQVVRSLTPITINELSIRDGTIRFRNFNSSPPVNLAIHQVQAKVENISNAGRPGKEQQARLEATGMLFGSAPTSVYGIFDPLSDYRNFDINLKVSDLDLRHGNALTRAYANFDFQSGRGDFILDLRAKDGKLDGYAKPLLNEVDILDWKDADSLEGSWEAMVAAMGWLLRNHDKDRIGSQIEIKGDIGDGDVSTWQAFVSILRNAFIQAYEAKFQRE